MNLNMEMKVLAGADSKAFLIDLGKIVDRLEQVARVLRSDEEHEKAAGKTTTAKTTEVETTEDADFTSAPAKGKAGKKLTSSFDDEGTEEAEEDETPAPTPAKKAAKAPKITMDDVNDACKARAQATTRKEVLGILKKGFGVTSVTDLEPAQYGEVIKALKE